MLSNEIGEMKLDVDHVRTKGKCSAKAEERGM